MASDNDREGLHDLLQCLVCLGEYESPKMLSCGHSFCAGCLEPILGELSYRREIRCPACRAMSRLPWTGIPGLPDDFKINRIREIVENQREESGITSCDFCKFRRLKVRSQYHCTQCYKYLCKPCVQKHDKNTLFKSHRVVELAEGGAIIDFTSTCELHAREPVRYFCQVCRQLLCTLCTLEHDQQHEVRPIDRMLEQYQLSLQALVDRLAAKLANILPLRRTLELRIKEQEEACEISEKAIRTLTENIIAEARDQERDLLNELDKERDKRMENAGLHIVQSLNAKVNEIENLNERIGTLLKETSNPLDMLLGYETITSSCKTVLDLVIPDEVPEDPITRTVLHFVESDDRHMTTLGHLTTVEVGSYETSALDRFLSPSEIDKGWLSRFRSFWIGSRRDRGLKESGMRFINTHQNLPSVTSKDYPKCVMSISKMGTGFGEISAASDLSVLSDGTLVVSEFGNKRIQLFNEKGESQLTISGDTIPYGVAVTDQGNIISVDNKESTVIVYKRDGVVLSSWGEGFFQKPHGIAVSQNGYVVVSDIGKHCISVHDGLCGRRIREFGSQGNMDTELNHPFYLTVDSNDNIIVSDCWNNCIKIFDMHGRLLFKFGTYGTEDGQLRYPGSVCVDERNNYIVADTLNHRICNFTSDGHFISNLLTPDDGIWYPSGLGLTQCGQLVLSECNGMRHTAVKVFSI